MEQAKKIVDYISDSIANISSILVERDVYYEPTCDIECNDIDTLTTQDWSKDNECSETIAIQRSDYDKLCSELSLTNMQLSSHKIKEKEYKKMIDEYDKTLSYFLDKNDHNKSMVIETIRNKRKESDICLINEVDRLRSAEQRLKAHIKALKKDLCESEKKSDIFKNIALENINALKQEIEDLKGAYETQKEKNIQLRNKVERLEDIVEHRCEENIELLEYCKFLLR